MSASDVLQVAIAVDRVSRRQHFALEVEVEVPPGITILFGPSGCGKSTLLQAIAGLLRPEHGRIAIGDAVLFDSEARVDTPVQRRRIAYVFQSLALFPHLSALANVSFAVDRRLPGRERRERARALLARLGVEHLAERRPRTFSGGEAQRVALARALATSPRIILLDEPLSALDLDRRISIARELREVVAGLAIPAIHVTHNHGEARAMGDRVVRMAAGKVAEVGSADQVLGRRRQHRSEREPD